MSGPGETSDLGPAARTSSVSVVVPVYRGSATLRELHCRTLEQLGADNDDWELIFVDDCSPDGSWEVIEQLHREDPGHVVALQMSRNFGQHAALLAGVRISTKDIVVTMDDDLQHRPSTISTLIGALGQGNDLVYGVPEKGEHAKWRNITSRTAKWILSNTIGAEQARNSSAFRAFRRELSDGWSRVSDPYVSLDVLLSWVTTSHAAIPIPMDERAAGTSNYSFLKLMRHMLNMMTGYSTRPLRLVTLLGFLASFAGLASLFFVIGRWWMTENATPGFAFLASMISVFGGLQLFALGVIGEYLGRMHVRSMSKPAYNVRRSVGIV